MSWGRPMWTVIHTWAASYNPTETEIAGAVKYYNDLTRLIPCPRCAEHFAEILAADPVEPHLGSREELMEWTWRVHNAVNESLNKPTMSLDDFNNVWKPSITTHLTGSAIKSLYGLFGPK